MAPAELYLLLGCRTFISEVITGYLPSLILQQFLSLIPPVMVVLSSMRGYIALSQIQKSACIKVLWFPIWNFFFFANVLSGSALYRVSLLLDPKNIPTVLAEAVPGQVLKYPYRESLFFLQRVALH